MMATTTSTEDTDVLSSKGTMLPSQPYILFRVGAERQILVMCVM
jgi:hypothetical protein